VCGSAWAAAKKVMAGTKELASSDVEATGICVAVRPPLWPWPWPLTSSRHLFFILASIFWKGSSRRSKHCSHPTTKNAFISLHRCCLLFCCVGPLEPCVPVCGHPPDLRVCFFFLWRRRQERSEMVGSSSARRRRCSSIQCPSSAPLKENLSVCLCSYILTP
jgi:hypothetical protein